MKCTKVLNLFLASVVLITAAAGCKRNPKNITNIPGQIRNGPQGLRMLMKGKLPLPVVQQERVDNPKEVRKIYEAVGTGEER